MYYIVHVKNKSMYWYNTMNIPETTHENIHIYKLDYNLRNQSKYEKVIIEQEKI